MNRTFINFAFTALAAVILASCKPAGGPGAQAQNIFKANQVVFDAVIREIYRENANFIAPDAAATELNVFDFDHTLSNTETMIPIKDASGKVADKRDSKCFHVGKGEKADFSVFTRDRLMAGTGVSLALDRARAHNRAKGALVFVVTARGQPHTFQSARTYLAKKGIRVHAVIAVHSPLLMNKLWKKLKLPAGMKKLPRGMKKPLLIAALLEYARERNARIKTIRYYEDTDKYIGAYIQFMSRAYPNVTAEVYDYIRVGKPNKRTYSQKLVARIEKGRALNKDGQPVAAPGKYDSRDCPPPPGS